MSNDPTQTSAPDDPSSRNAADEGSPAAKILEAIPPPSADVLDKYPWRNPAQWVVWSERHISGRTHSFEHLLPFDMALTRPAKGKYPELSIDIRVVFDCHVVTESFNPLAHMNPPPEETWRDAGNRLRVFHTDRYQLSMELPTMIRGMVADGNNPRCFEANRKNFMVLERRGQPPSTEYYHVFFDLYRSPRIQGNSSRLIMYIQSAYIKDVPLQKRRTDSTLFAAVCAKKMGIYS